MGRKAKKRIIKKSIVSKWLLWCSPSPPPPQMSVPANPSIRGNECSTSQGDVGEEWKGGNKKTEGRGSQSTFHERTSRLHQNTDWDSSSGTEGKTRQDDVTNRINSGRRLPSGLRFFWCRVCRFAGFDKYSCDKYSCDKYSSAWKYAHDAR